MFALSGIPALSSPWGRSRIIDCELTNLSSAEERESRKVIYANVDALPQNRNQQLSFTPTDSVIVDYRDILRESKIDWNNAAFPFLPLPTEQNFRLRTSVSDDIRLRL